MDDSLKIKNYCNEILFNSEKYSYLKDYYDANDIDRANAFKVLFNNCSLIEYRKTTSEIYYAYQNLYNIIQCEEDELFRDKILNILKKSYELLSHITYIQPSKKYLKIEKNI
jgi:hypothetical protein